MGHRAGRIEQIVSEAIERSAALIEILPAGQRTHRTNAERVVLICKEFILTKPAQEPLAPHVSEAGGIRYGKFPATQSLLNRYRELLRIWREAFRKVVDVSAPAPKKHSEGLLEIAAEDLASLDSGTKGRIRIIMAVLREQKLENDRLKKLVREHVPAPGRAVSNGGEAILSAAQAQIVSNWLAKLELGQSGLEVEAAGVRISRRAHPRQVVMPADVLDVLMVLRETCARSPKMMGESTKALPGRAEV